MIEALTLIAAMHFPVEFERQYINRAWGYTHQRCVIDSRGHVWFENTTTRPSKVRRVRQAEYLYGIELAQQSADEKYYSVMVGVDMGDLTWSFRYGDEITTIKTRGNYRGGPISAASEKLVALIDRWCEDEPHYPAYIDRP